MACGSAGTSGRPAAWRRRGWLSRWRLCSLRWRSAPTCHPSSMNRFSAAGPPAAPCSTHCGKHLYTPVWCHRRVRGQWVSNSHLSVCFSQVDYRAKLWACNFCYQRNQVHHKLWYFSSNISVGHIYLDVDTSQLLYLLQGRDFMLISYAHFLIFWLCCCVKV